MSAPRPEVLARVREFAERQLTPEQLRAALAIPIGSEERARTRELIRWFKTRYSTAAERLAYARRAYGRWMARSGPPGSGHAGSPKPDPTARKGSGS